MFNKQILIPGNFYSVRGQAPFVFFRRQDFSLDYSPMGSIPTDSICFFIKEAPTPVDDYYYMFLYKNRIGYIHKDSYTFTQIDY